MVLMNNLIKKYSLSDDLNEYSKKVEVWNSIKDCGEIKSFMLTSDSIRILKRKYYKKDICSRIYRSLCIRKSKI